MGGAQWSYSYDLVGNRLTVSDPDLGNWSYKYDGANRLVEQRDARGTVTTMRYDQLGRLLERQVTSPSVANPILLSNTYDEARTGYYNVGQLTTSETPGVVVHRIDWRASGNEAKRVTTVTAGGTTHQ
ncbi:RHS repeat domain-containing protein, partial [Nitratireductor sp. ZSWI3]|uniref:RHS repeat domain-containing protein n=1 Tax=Nitratireductor sp. ZSWI3 TaxID=2966359 RepID=UPI0035AE4EF1